MSPRSYIIHNYTIIKVEERKRRERNRFAFLDFPFCNNLFVISYKFRFTASVKDIRHRKWNPVGKKRGTLKRDKLVREPSKP